MMTVPWRDLARLPCVPEKGRRKDTYIGDHIIRQYRPLGLTALLRDLGAGPATPELEIVGGIGRLVLRADGTETWDPTLPGTPRRPNGVALRAFTWRCPWHRGAWESGRANALACASA